MDEITCSDHVYSMVMTGQYAHANQELIAGHTVIAHLGCGEVSVLRERWVETLQLRVRL